MIFESTGSGLEVPGSDGAASDGGEDDLCLRGSKISF